jgi:predicted ATPase
VDGAEQIRLLLARVPTLTVLATSRLRPGLRGEQEFPVPPLPIPTAPGALLHCPSVQLFLDRAQAVHPGLPLTPANLEAVVELCQSLEGLPLAVELAAARVGVLTPQQMVTRLSRRFELLESRQRGIDPRHRSLRATLQWSYQLLAPETRSIFARLSVFRGGWTLAAAVAVCGEQDTGDCLNQLHDASLVLLDESGTEPRYRMLETVREFAAEQLTSEEQARVSRQHAEYFLSLAETAEVGRKGLTRLQSERENLDAALAWAAEESAPFLPSLQALP